jgi:hypothetical protein
MHMHVSRFGMLYQEKSGSPGWSRTEGSAHWQAQQKKSTLGSQNK